MENVNGFTTLDFYVKFTVRPFDISVGCFTYHKLDKSKTKYHRWLYCGVFVFLCPKILWHSSLHKSDGLNNPFKETECGRSEMCVFRGWVINDCCFRLVSSEVTAWEKLATLWRGQSPQPCGQSWGQLGLPASLEPVGGSPSWHLPNWWQPRERIWQN